MGNHGPVVHFSSGAKSGDHSPHGQEFLRLLVLGVFIFPDVFFQKSLGGNDFAAVDDGTAAYGQNEVDFLLPGQTGSFLDLFVGRIGHDPGEFKDGFAGFFQDGHQLAVHTISFDGTAPVGQQDMRTHFGQLCRQMGGCCSFSKIRFDWIAVGKCFHENTSFLLTSSGAAGVFLSLL